MLSNKSIQEQFVMVERMEVKLSKSRLENANTLGFFFYRDIKISQILGTSIHAIRMISRSERIPHAGSYWLFCKIMVFSIFKLKVTYCHSSTGNK